MAAFAAHLQVLGVRRIDPPPGFETNGIWFRDDDGTPIDVHVAEKSSPAEKTRAEVADPPPRVGAGAAPKRSQAGTTSPNRLAHLLLFTPDVDAAVKFYGRVLGLRLSDRSSNNIAFMHGIHGSDHHMVAFVKSDATAPFCSPTATSRAPTRCQQLTHWQPPSEKLARNMVRQISSLPASRPSTATPRRLGRALLSVSARCSSPTSPRSER
ncbi:catechol 2,3-dioxygenase-like lactoylglutathione lyase family enzyme [Bradyrhizobium sp. JR7.2]